MKRLHIVPGLDAAANGMAVVARLLAGEQGDAEVVDLGCGTQVLHEGRGRFDEVWVHGMWLPREWTACRAALRGGARLVRMTHGSLSPLYLKRQSPLRKSLAGPFERHFLRRAERIVATCEAEAEWIRAYLGESRPPVEVTDLKRFFNLPVAAPAPLRLSAEGGSSRPLHLLYIGRRHPLKGLAFLEEAVGSLNVNAPAPAVELRVVTSASGEEKERAWDWCDALVLPTLSENFGLVVAEALERGKRAIATDGAPAWDGCGDYGGWLAYLRGYRDGSPSERAALLSDAIGRLLAQ